MSHILTVFDDAGNEIPIPAIKGKDGIDGKTPEKGIDYFTDDEKAELVNDVLAALPTWEGGSY